MRLVSCEVGIRGYAYFPYLRLRFCGHFEAFINKPANRIRAARVADERSATDVAFPVDSPSIICLIFQLSWKCLWWVEIDPEEHWCCVSRSTYECKGLVDLVEIPIGCYRSRNNQYRACSGRATRSQSSGKSVRRRNVGGRPSGSPRHLVLLMHPWSSHR